MISHPSHRTASALRERMIEDMAVRIDAAGRVRALSDIPVPRRYADLFTEIPEHRFRVDTSSSDIRTRARADGGRAVGNS